MTRPGIAALLIFALIPSGTTGRLVEPAAAAVSPDEVQEDWQVVISTPDPAGAGPQISTSMSPVADGSTPFFIFNLNYREATGFQPGGLEVEAYSGDTLLGSSSKGTAQCSTNNETITWTQGMKITSGVVSFAINSGRSTTWGKFGQGQQLDLSSVTFQTGLTSLSSYSPSVSVSGSGVGWERNRLTSMTLLRVRYYAAGKLLSTDSTSRSISLAD